MKYLLVSFFTFSLFAYPTPEALFTNAGNQEVTANTIQFTFKLTELPPEKEMVLVSPKDLGVEKDLIKQNFNQEPQYYKALFQKVSETRWEYIQAQYKRPSMKSDSIVHLYESGDFLNQMSKKTTLNPSQDLFYSSIFMFLLNERTPFVNFLKRSNKSFKENNELVNKDKKDLLEIYGRYLQTIKDDPTLKEELISPLKPDDPEEAKRVSEIMKQPFFKRFEGITLVRDQENFFLKFALENFEARFSNSDYKIESFVFEDLGRRIAANFYNYVLLNGKHEVPKFIVYNIGSRKFKIEFLSLKHMSYNNVTYRRVKSSLKEAIGKTQSTYEFSLRPKFIL